MSLRPVDPEDQESFECQFLKERYRIEPVDELSPEDRLYCKLMAKYIESGLMFFFSSGMKDHMAFTRGDPVSDLVLSQFSSSHIRAKKRILKQYPYHSGYVGLCDPFTNKTIKRCSDYEEFVDNCLLCYKQLHQFKNVDSELMRLPDLALWHMAYHGAPGMSEEERTSLQKKQGFWAKLFHK